MVVKRLLTISSVIVAACVLVPVSGPAVADPVPPAGGAGQPIPGDANLDGYVEGGDYTLWADNYGRTDATPWSQGGWAEGNFNEDTLVEGGDYTLWADNYMRVIPEAPPDPHTPAPAAVTLGLIGLALIGWRMRRYA